MDATTWNELESGRWADMNLRRCPCRGRGWFLSDFDTWHRCPIHGKNVPHPEDNQTEFDFRAHLLQGHRNAFESLRSEAHLAGYQGSFTEACRVELALQGVSHPATAAQWVNAAEVVSARWVDAAAEADDQTYRQACGFLPSRVMVSQEH